MSSSVLCTYQVRLAFCALAVPRTGSLTGNLHPSRSTYRTPKSIYAHTHTHQSPLVCPRITHAAVGHDQARRKPERTP